MRKYGTSRCTYLLDALWMLLINTVHLPSCSKFLRESCDPVSFFHIYASYFCIKNLGWHISKEVWFVYLNICCSCCTAELLANVNKLLKMVSLLAKNVNIFRLLQKCEAKIWKQLRRSEDSPWNFVHNNEWMVLINSLHKTSIICKYLESKSARIFL